LPVIAFDSIEYASLTDVGIRRSYNQDAHASLLASDEEQWHERGHVFLVADGMGAHAVGELASELAVSIIPHTYHKYAPQTGIPALRKAFVEANATIYAKGQQNPEFGGMGTTTTALLLRPEGAWVGHVGDSRVYRIRDHTIEQLSFDHSLIWEMARRQGVDPDGLAGVIPSNVIVRSLGPEPLVQVDVEGPHAIQPGDLYLLCSDGLSGQVSDAEIGAIASALPPAEACRVLIDLANLGGGPDNVTVLIVRVSERSGEPHAVPRDSRPLHRRIPWFYSALVAGVLLTGAAAYLNWQGYKGVGLSFFGLATLVVAAGLVGQAVSLAQEKRRQPVEPEPQELHIYRQVPCRLERPLVEKVAAALSRLEPQIKEKQWEVDWSSFREHHEAAQKLLREQNLTDAFREFCRALRPLADAVHRQRPKGDVFQAVWD
jgi:protein phosphatase